MRGGSSECECNAKEITQAGLAATTGAIDLVAMRPMFPAIFCTVASGAGLGLLVLLVLVEIAAYGGGLSKRMLASGFAMAAVLISGGLGASVLNLVNPTSSTRARVDWKRSWVSREALLVIALYPVAAIYVWSVFARGAECSSCSW